MPPTAIFGFRAQWRVLPGMAYGLRLPVMCGSVVVAPVGRPALALLDGQPRPAAKDKGADELLPARVTARVLTASDVGPHSG